MINFASFFELVTTFQPFSKWKYCVLFAGIASLFRLNLMPNGLMANDSANIMSFWSRKSPIHPEALEIWTILIKRIEMVFYTLGALGRHSGDYKRDMKFQQMKHDAMKRLNEHGCLSWFFILFYNTLDASSRKGVDLIFQSKTGDITGHSWT